MPFGVSNSFRRGMVKTYTKQRTRFENSQDIDRPRKRICMDQTGQVVEKQLCYGSQDFKESTQAATQSQEVRAEEEAPAQDRRSSITAPSSPPRADHPIFSSDAPPSDSELSSPPSPPPQIASPMLVSRKPAFSFLKRKRSATNDFSRPLSSITANAQKAPKPFRKVMTQMQIDLGGAVRKTCRACGMEYIPSVREDATLHKEYCGMNVGGIEMGKPFLKDESVKKLRLEKLLGGQKECLIVVDRRSSVAARNKTKRVLEVVNAELSAADLADDQLWGHADGETDEKKSTANGKGGAAAEKRPDRFKAFLHLVGEKCVGFCLAEKISNAFPVVNKKIGRPEILSTSMSSSISYSASAEIVLLGISRIWTSKSHRGHGLAINLLEYARENFFYGIEVPRHLVAFSQPTESGGKLAKRWFKSETGWHVYHGSEP